jgi:site-specific DNA-methyltransferase (adenine-specific)
MKNKIIFDDCIKVMKSMNVSSVDHTITDIPYDVITRESNGIRNFDKEEADELIFNLEVFVKECTKVTKDTLMIFCASEQVSILSELFKDNGFSTDLAIWRKTNPSPVNGQYIWLSGLECCVVGNSGKLKESLKNVIWESPSGRSKNHPTEKPLKLLSLIIENHTDVGDLIFDPCSGSGSTLEAAAIKNRGWLGVEIFEKYFKNIERRMEKY